MNQGRSKKQMETNYKLTLWSFVGLAVSLIIALLSS